MIMKNTSNKIKGVDETVEPKDSSPVSDSPHVKLKVKRMQAVLKSPSVQMPSGLTKEEMRAFILAHAKS
jgi:hypothetical protein